MRHIDPQKRVTVQQVLHDMWMTDQVAPATPISSRFANKKIKVSTLFSKPTIMMDILQTAVEATMNALTQPMIGQVELKPIAASGVAARSAQSRLSFHFISHPCNEQTKNIEAEAFQVRLISNFLSYFNLLFFLGWPSLIPRMCRSDWNINCLTWNRKKLRKPKR